MRRGAVVNEDEWTREAVRLHRRYQTEIVEAYRLCPWADRATRDGRVRETVYPPGPTPTRVEPSLAAIDSWIADPTVDVAFAIYPRLGLGRQAFHDFRRSRARRRHRRGTSWGACRSSSRRSIPEADPDTGDPERLIPFLRRTPDPTLQFLRASTLDGIRTGSAQGTQFLDIASLDAVLSGTAQPPLRERIARANLAHGGAMRHRRPATRASTTFAGTATRPTERSQPPADSPGTSGGSPAVARGMLGGGHTAAHRRSQAMNHPTTNRAAAELKDEVKKGLELLRTSGTKCA